MLGGPRAEHTAASAWRLLEAARRVAMAGVALDEVIAALVDQATTLVAADDGSLELVDAAGQLRGRAFGTAPT